jgi:hypothetical protein
MVALRSHPKYHSRVAIPLAVCTICLALAALTLLVPSAPTTDPWGWIVWGRELAHFKLNTDIHGTPSWKPLPVLVTAPLSLLGTAAPTLWVWLSRAAALLGLVMGFRVAARLVGNRGAAARWGAGALAVFGLFLSSGWVRAFSHAYTEPLAIALLLGAIDRHLAGRPRQALILGALVCGTRPEAFPLVALYGALLWRRKEAGLGLVAATLVAVPASWLIPDWIGSGDPFHGSTVAHDLLTTTPQDLWAAVRIAPIPLAVAAILAAVHAAKIRDWTFVALALSAGVWAGLLRLMIALGYPPSDRFFFLPAVIVCVLGAAGLVRLALAPRVRLLTAALTVAVLGLAAWSFGGRLQGAVDGARDAAARARTESELSRAITLAGGAGVSSCGVATLPNPFRWLRGVIAWRLGLPLGEIYGLTAEGAPRTTVGLIRGSRGDVAGETVLVTVPRKATVMFLPYAKNHVHFTDRPGRPQPVRVGTSGHWSVYANAVPRCRHALTRTR